MRAIVEITRKRELSKIKKKPRLWEQAGAKVSSTQSFSEIRITSDRYPEHAT
jgi:hypothetical protein